GETAARGARPGPRPRRLSAASLRSDGRRGRVAEEERGGEASFGGTILTQAAVSDTRRLWHTTDCRHRESTVTRRTTDECSHLPSSGTHRHAPYNDNPTIVRRLRQRNETAS